MGTRSVAGLALATAAIFTADVAVLVTRDQAPKPPAPDVMRDPEAGSANQASNDPPPLAAPTTAAPTPAAPATTAAPAARSGAPAPGKSAPAPAAAEKKSLPDRTPTLGGPAHLSARMQSDRTDARLVADGVHPGGSAWRLYASERGSEICLQAMAAHGSGGGSGSGCHDRPFAVSEGQTSDGPWSFHGFVPQNAARVEIFPEEREPFFVRPIRTADEFGVAFFVGFTDGYPMYDCTSGELRLWGSTVVAYDAGGRELHREATEGRTFPTDGCRDGIG